MSEHEFESPKGVDWSESVKVTMQSVTGIAPKRDVHMWHIFLKKSKMITQMKLCLSTSSKRMQHLLLIEECTIIDKIAHSLFAQLINFLQTEEVKTHNVI